MTGKYLSTLSTFLSTKKVSLKVDTKPINRLFSGYKPSYPHYPHFIPITQVWTWWINSSVYEIKYIKVQNFLKSTIG